MNHTTLISSQEKKTQNGILNIKITIIRLKGDSGASGHFMREGYHNCLENIFNAPGPMLIMPNSGTLQERKRGSLTQPSILSPVATITTIVAGLKSSSLLSLGHIFDYGCNLILNKQRIYTIKDKAVMVKGEQDRRNSLWDIILLSHPNKNIYTNQQSHHNSIPCNSLYKKS